MIHRRRLIFPALLLLAAFAPALRAQDGPLSFTLDLPFGADEATPSWLGHPVTPPATFATLDLPVMPPQAGSSLLVTVFFQEKNGGFLRISWQGGSASTDSTDALPGPGEQPQSALLCENFYEGIGMSNQRSLLITADTLQQPGQLVFQCGDSTLGISRIRLEWLQSSTGLSSPAITDMLVTPADGHTQPQTALDGQPPAASDLAWQGRIVNVPLTDVPLRIEQGVDYTVQMDDAPTLARVGLKEAGLPWGWHLVAWINNQHAGIIVPAVPPLGDGGYPDEKGSAYVGWREGTFYVPASLLTAGNNTLQFSAEPDMAPAAPADPNAASAPLALKDVVLQLDYPANSTATARVAPAGDAPNANTISPAAASTPPPVSDAADTPATTTPAPNLQNPGLLSLPVSTPSSSTP
jgi:hypothetical protein